MQFGTSSHNQNSIQHKSWKSLGKDNNAEEEEAKDFSQQLSISLVICLSLLPWERHSILKGQLRILPHHS